MKQSFPARKKKTPLIANFLKRKAQVLFIIDARLLQPVRNVSAQVPVVFMTSGDPIAARVVKSFSRRHETLLR
jgi:ABC-type uncharacterized transport system substrate-binding protein